MQSLYPEIKPYARHELAVEEPHVLYVDESGTPDGLPVLFVHGGPGGGCDALSRRFFDPTVYRIITFDQRGCGRSTPHASLENNTTAHLIADMQRIREFLGIDKWVLFGGSWGSTLSLAYAQAHPRMCMRLSCAASSSVGRRTWPGSTRKVRAGCSPIIGTISSRRFHRRSAAI